MEGGELFDRIVDESFDLTERVAILFMRQITDAMMYIHSQNILHLDMKVSAYNFPSLCKLLLNLVKTQQHGHTYIHVHVNQ